MKKISVLIVEDHTLIRQAWAMVLNADPRFHVVAESPNAEEGIKLARYYFPDVVLMDIQMPGVNGIEATERLQQSVPGVKVLGVSSHTNPAYAQKMVRNGALGYVTKSSSSQELMKAIVEVQSGRRYICQDIRNAIAEQAFSGEKEKGIECLSKREIEIIEMIRQGLASREMAERLYISEKTVEVHRYNILKKLKIRNTAALVNYINHQMVH
jgi:DNA-binding NarL/FixJ family response regulator